MVARPLLLLRSRVEKLVTIGAKHVIAAVLIESIVRILIEFVVVLFVVKVIVKRRVERVVIRLGAIAAAALLLLPPPPQQQTPLPQPLFLLLRIVLLCLLGEPHRCFETLQPRADLTLLLLLFGSVCSAQTSAISTPSVCR